MKKFLSLVLALVMAMSLVTISAGAKDFTDSEDVKYDAAVEVMSELKVIDGYTDGSFRPATELNRGAAAKIICNMILGPTTASALSASSAPFSDVPADSVFAGYITYCSKEGIIDGYADGTFRPTAPLTGYAFAKMLLGALGYDPAIEGYVGANWSINVAKQALGIDLDAGIDGFVGTQYVNRETACQMALNTLKADMVRYNAKTTVTVNGAEVVVGGSEYFVETNYAETESFEDDDVMQFAEKYFSNLKVFGNKADEFGRPATEWKIKNKSVGVFADDADASYTAAVKGKAIYSDLGDAAKIKIAYEDGLDVTEELPEGFAIAKKNDKEIGGQGTLTEVFYDADKEEATIVIVNTYIMQVSGDYDEDEESIELVEVDGSECALKSATVYTDDFAMIAELEDEDYVLVTIAADKDEKQYVASIELAEPTTAVVDEHVEDESLTADGTEYKFAAAWKATAEDYDYEVDDEYDLYFDFYGNIIFSEPVEEEDPVYLFAYEFAKNNHMNKKAKVEAYAYFVDGSEETIGVKKFDGDKLDGTDAAILQNGTEGAEAEAMQWVSFVENSDGTYDLKPVEDIYGAVKAGTEITNDKNVMIETAEGKIRGTKATVFVVVDEDGEVEVYTGIKNVPALTAGENAYVAAVCDSEYAEYVFVELGKDGIVDGGEDESKDMIFFLKWEKDGTDAADNDYYRYKAILNGEEGKVRTEIEAISGKDDLVKGLYTDVKYDSESGYVSAAELVDTVKGTDDDATIDVLEVKEAEVTQKSGVISVKDEVEDEIKVEKYYMADDAVIYVINAKAEVETYTAKQLVKEYGAKLTATIYGVIADGEYTALYILL